MSDLPEELYQRAARMLTGSRVSYARYLQLLEAQREALRADDIDLLAHLAADGVTLLEQLDERIQLPSDLLEALARSQGPLRDDVERLLETVQLEVSMAHGEIRRFATALEARRMVMVATLERLHNSPQPYPVVSTPKGLPPPDDSVP